MMSAFGGDADILCHQPNVAFDPTQTSSIREPTDSTSTEPFEMSDLTTPQAKLKSTSSAANALVDEAANLHLLRAVNITEVDNDRSRHFLL